MLGLPLLTHFLLGILYTFILTCGAYAVLALPLTPWQKAGVFGAMLVSTFFYGREAGQREHDLKHKLVPWSGTKAWLGAEFLWGWAWSNVCDWLAAVGGTFIAFAVIYYLGR